MTAAPPPILPCCRSLPDAQKERIEKKREKAAEEKKAEARRAQKDAQEKRIRDGKIKETNMRQSVWNKTDEASEADWENTVTITASSIEELLKRSAITSRMSG